ncbi:MAG: glycosyl transferase, partial [Candidatus Glassbacteria bacterium]|nr:glycosyl transferase [Candidatus Glassbacteria bacterium]
IREKRQGKGYVISSMFDKILADYYVMIDGDNTYPAEYSSKMVGMLIDEEADIVVANRLEGYHETRVRPFHHFGNRLVRFLINSIFSARIKDPMSGFRAFTYDAVAALPFLSTGFEIETEITIQALFRKLVIREIDIPYRDRPEGSYSKLNTFSDGISVLVEIFMLLKAYKPMTFFGTIGILFFLSGMATGWVVVLEFIGTGFITHVPLAILTILLIMAGFIFAVTGIIIHTVNYRILEASTITLKYIRHLRDFLAGRGAGGC